MAAFRIAELASNRQHPTRAPAAPVDVGSRVGFPSSACAWTTIDRSPMNVGEFGSSETIASVKLIVIVPPLDATLPKSPACLRNSYMYGISNGGRKGQIYLLILLADSQPTRYLCNGFPALDMHIVSFLKKLCRQIFRHKNFLYGVFGIKNF